MIKPWHTLGLLLGVGGLCLMLMSVFPGEGVQIGEDITLEFETLEDFLAEEEPVIEDIEEFLEVYEVEVDSVAILDSLEQIEIRRRQELMKIQFPEGKEDILDGLFAALESAKTSSETMHILHYGDSQIEGDRITGYIRNEIQKQFGGNGPGLLPIYEVIPSIAVDQSASENWIRYTVFGKKDSTVTHSRYGVLANFNRFTPILPDSISPDSTTTSWISYKPSKLSYRKTRKWNNVRLYTGFNTHPVTMQAFLGDSAISTDFLAADSTFNIKQWNLEDTPEEFRLEFQGKDSPECYAVSLEGNSGVQVDNIAMRGSSGTIFKKINRDLLSRQYKDLNVKMFILQFGGNTVPYITSTEKADKYGSWFASQIKYLQKMVPEAAIVVIGPSDMAVKDKGNYVSRDYLVEVRDALKKAAFETNCGFWDIYEVMGGRNSMQSWVNADPPLAASDYTHFTPKGARRIAELFHKALMQEYEDWSKKE